MTDASERRRVKARLVSQAAPTIPPPSKAETQLATRLAELPKLGRKALYHAFEEAYGRKPPMRLSDKILQLAIAYRWQEKIYGGLKSEIRKQLLSPQHPLPPKKASPGTLLVREWHGKQHQVTVFEGYVEYAGERFGSLTAVARRITGRSWSGPLFFGLTAKARSEA